MMRSMFAGVSGLRSHQTVMDVVGHNIANVNTAGFKASQITFQEALAQIVRGPSGAGAGRGGINPLQLGLGTNVATIDGVFTQDATQLTGRATDLAIQGDGFFILSQGAETLYTRAGSFSFDEVGRMSNVDLALEFTNLIIAQRGFQANSRIITTSDELLGDLVNLKR